MAQIIKVRFAQGDSHMRVDTRDVVLSARDYDYFFVGDNVKVTDKSFAVVNVMGTLKIVKIERLVKVSTKATKFAICVFDLESYEANIAKTQKIADLKAAIVDQAESVKKRRQLEELAAGDSTLAAMFEELKALEAGDAV